VYFVKGGRIYGQKEKQKSRTLPQASQHQRGNDYLLYHFYLPGIQRLYVSETGEDSVL